MRVIRGARASDHADGERLKASASHCGRISRTPRIARIGLVRDATIPLADRGGHDDPGIACTGSYCWRLPYRRALRPENRCRSRLLAIPKAQPSSGAHFPNPLPPVSRASPPSRRHCYHQHRPLSYPLGHSTSVFPKLAACASRRRSNLRRRSAGCARRTRKWGRANMSVISAGAAAAAFTPPAEAKSRCRPRRTTTRKSCAFASKPTERTRSSRPPGYRIRIAGMSSSVGPSRLGCDNGN
jgi:hypothetical protein